MLVSLLFISADPGTLVPMYSVPICFIVIIEAKVRLAPLVTLFLFSPESRTNIVIKAKRLIFFRLVF